MTRWIVPPLRRVTQALAVLLLVLLPLFALYTHYHEARAIGDLTNAGWQGRALRIIDRAVGDSETRGRFVTETQGTFWSARVAGVSLSDPLAAAEAIVSSKTFYGPLLASLVIPLVVTVVFGRVFCGWICPMNTLLEIVDKCRRLLRLVEIRERDVRFSLMNKYVMLGLLLGLVAVSGIPLAAMFYPPAVLSREFHLFVFGSAVGIGVYFILAIAAIELFISRRWWCRYVCPGGALYSLLGHFRVVRVRRRDSLCTQCGDCVRTCQFGLRPMQVTTTGQECTNCAACVTSCSTGALSMALVLPTLPGGTEEKSAEGNSLKVVSIDAPRAQPVGKSESSRPPKRLPMILLAIVTCQAATASAHHILGLPHYSYKENYPQAPTLEYPATTGPYDVLMTSYPGKPVPGEAATIAFYIKNRNTANPYDQPVTVQVLETSTFGSNRVVHEPSTHSPFDNQHKYTVTFPNDGEYIVELTMDVEGREEVIPFLIVAGNPTAAGSVLAAVAVGLTVFVVVVRAIKIKRTRKARAPAGAAAC